jgi:glycosyltransferase involved in cell wall biosynthesis
MKLSLIIPAYNEEKTIKDVIDEARDYVDEIVVVDDGSDDNTAKSVINYIKNNPRNHKKIKLIEHEKRLGKAAALDTGVENSSGDIVLFTEADNTYPACYFPRLVKEIEEGADLVIGSRFLSPQLNNLSFSHRLGNKMIMGLLFNESIVSTLHKIGETFYNVGFAIFVIILYFIFRIPKKEV